ncbi:hypothetical protein FAZ78_10585 [Cereibacter changlensis]|uniref:PRC-barrel domain-containing protein n=1 Tax=Cereibacter changlensis TaxID=402884 RepID=A0A4U0Z031_9RHOB|nr:PRC-barrel domain-containing protein [Cereibacter changlensis]TKA96609.1 hypothetical protein FAZ78_10585 [Cereibacter changlensis]
MNKFVTLTAALATMTAFSVHAQDSGSTDGSDSGDSASESQEDSTSESQEGGDNGTDGITTDPTELADPALNSPAEAADTPMVDSTTTASTSPTEGYTVYSGTPVMASSLQNVNIYTTEGQVVGAVSQVVSGADGSASQIVFDVGQYMGADSKMVAVPVGDIELYNNADSSEYRIVLPMSEAEIQSMPEYPM